MTLDQGRDVGVVRPGQEIALPMTRKRLEILKEAMPKTTKVVYLSSNEWLDSTGSSYREAGQRLGIALIVKYLSEVDEAQLRRAFDQIAEEQFDAALIDEGGSFLAQRALIVDLAQLLRADEVIE
jgi:putative ABC transport system substrate-binding protein